jgi:hypothetical protein
MDRIDYKVQVREVSVRTVGHLKVTLLLLQATAFTGATLCYINDLHGYAERLFSAWLKIILFVSSFVPFVVYLLFAIKNRVTLFQTER